jgi:hypothetical protein
MAKPYVVQVKDAKQRRIVVAKQAWNEEQLQEGDYIEVTIRKINLGEK